MMIAYSVENPMTERHVPGKFHPGEYLGDELKARKITHFQFATDCAMIGLGFGYIVEVLYQYKPVTKPVAVGFEILLGSSAEMWLGLQKEYDR